MRQLHVLLVEDNPVDKKVIELMVSKKQTSQMDLDICLKHSGTLHDAIEMMQAEKFNLVLLDLGLPDSWGIETFEKIHKHSNGVPVVIISSINDEAMALMAMEIGARKYLVKGTISKQELLDEIMAVSG